VTDEVAVEAMVSRVVDELGAVDILVNNVAATINKGLLDTTLEEWDRVLAITLRSTFLCSKFTARAMIAAGNGGAIVNVASTSGQRGIRNKVRLRCREIRGLQPDPGVGDGARSAPDPGQHADPDADREPGWDGR
jgi:NAD(P)-dependent dehydrogenase (short-subunit alcohol dehydrogenase family)